MRRRPLSFRAITECENRRPRGRRAFPAARCLSLELLEARTVLSVLPFNPDLSLPMPLPAPSEDDVEATPGIGQPISYNLATGEVGLDDPVLPLGNLPSSGQSVSGGLGAPTSLAPEDSSVTPRNFTNLTLVNDPSVYPWRVNVKLIATFPNLPPGVTSVCSGTLIDPMHVLTAGHCVYNQEHGGWATSILVVPGFEQEGATPSVPYGFANGTQAHSYPGWINNTSFDDDIGIIDLDRPIGALTGWFGYGVNDDFAFYANTFHNPGYPADTPYTGNLMYTWSGDFDSGDWGPFIGWFGNEMTINRKSYGGQSGSGAHWIDGQGNRIVYAVLSNGTDLVTNFPRITTDKFLNIGSIITEDTPSAVDLVALDVNVTPASVGAGGLLTSVSYAVHNYSSAASSGSVNVDVYLSTDEDITTADRLINSHSVSANLAAKGSAFPNRTDIVIPADVAAGNYFIGVIINSNDANTGNNDTSGQDAAAITVTGGAGAPEVVVELAGVNIVDGTATPIDFGSVVQGQTGPTRVFTVRNTGTQNLTLGVPSLPTGFTLDEGLSATIPAGGMDTFTVRLDSAVVGTKSGEISFTTNDSDENPFNFAITGQVTAVAGGPEIVVELAGVNIVDGSTTPIDFGSVVQGQTGPTRVFTVRNTGTQNLTLGAPSVPIGFTLDEGLSATILAGGMDTFTVRLDSAVLGTKSGQVSFSTNDSDENPFNFEITGQVTATAVLPEIVVELAGVNIPDGNTTPIDFGSVVQGQLGPSRVFTVRNTGGDVLLLSALSVPIGFTLDEGLSASIAPGGSDTFTVRLVSAVLGTKSGPISFTTNDSDEDPFDFEITGQVVETVLLPEIVVELVGVNIADGSTTPIDFGSVVQGQIGPTRVFTVRNTGTQNLTLGSVSLPIGFTLDEGLSASIASGGMDTFTVRLDNAVVGTKSGQISFSTNDSDENPFNFEITGQVTTVGSPPQIIDNSSATGFAFAGDWALGGGLGIGRDGNVRQAYGESFLTNVDTAAWTFNVTPGRYRVSTTWFTNTDSVFNLLWSTAAAYEVADGPRVLGTALVNQRLTPIQHPGSFSDSGSDWADVGTFDIAGATLMVKLLSGFDDKYVIADAVRVERIADLSPAAEIHVTMGGLYGLHIGDGSEVAGFGATDFNVPVQKTFSISNQGTVALSLTLPVTVTGSVFTIVQQPAVNTLNPGQSTTFVVQMSGATTGPQSATVSFGNSDGNENPYDFTVSGTVLSTRIIDDRDPGFFISPAPIEPGGWGINGGAGRPGQDGAGMYDYVYNINNPGVDEVATWTFNVTPGQYRVSTTWPFSFFAYDDAAPFTIFDGAVAGGIVRGGRNIDQKNTVPDDTYYPDGFGFPPGFPPSLARWETIDVVNISGNTLTVLLQAESTTEYVLADSILIDRLGDIPSGPEIVVVENNHNAAAGTLSYGTTQLNHPVEKTFTITNSGTSVLNITSPLGITGTNAAAFQVVSGPTSTAIVPGGTSTFVVRLTAAYEGTKTATISFTTNDADESTVNLNITGEVLNYRTIDDQNAADGYSQSGMTASLSGISYQGDVSSASSSTLQGPASATWTFSNMSPGTYYVALTWFDTSSNPSPYSSNTPVTVMDGAAVEGNFSVNQRIAPASFLFDGVHWLILGFFDFSGAPVTVTMTNANTDGVILADGVIIARTGGGIPGGNSEPLIAAANSSQSDNGRPEAYPTAARDAALSSTLYWNDVEDETAVLAEDAAHESDGLLADVARRRSVQSGETNLRVKPRRPLATAALIEDEA